MDWLRRSLCCSLLIASCGSSGAITPIEAADASSVPAITLSVQSAQALHTLTTNDAPYPAGTGAIFLWVTLTISNNTNVDALPLGYEQFALATTTPTQYQADYLTEHLNTTCITLAEGHSITCDVLFDISTAAEVIAVIYRAGPDGADGLTATAPIGTIQPPSN